MRSGPLVRREVDHGHIGEVYQSARTIGPEQLTGSDFADLGQIAPSSASFVFFCGCQSGASLEFLS